MMRAEKSAVAVGDQQADVYSAAANRIGAQPGGQREMASASVMDSPRMVAQRIALDGAFGTSLQAKFDDARSSGPAPDTANARLMRSPRMLAQRMALDGAFGTSLQTQTGLPAQLKAGVETLSGLAMDDVKVHYNSSKPAQLQAHAYAQGRDIHLAPGQEKHLPHEAWHVVQQKQGRVRPTWRQSGPPVAAGAPVQRYLDANGVENGLPPIGGGAPMAVDAEHVADDQMAMAVDAEHVADDQMAMAVDAEHVADDQMPMAIDGAPVADDQVHLAIDAAHVADASGHMVDGSAPMAVDQAPMAVDAFHMAGDPAHLAAPPSFTMGLVIPLSKEQKRKLAARRKANADQRLKEQKAAEAARRLAKAQAIPETVFGHALTPFDHWLVVTVDPNALEMSQRGAGQHKAAKLDMKLVVGTGRTYDIKDLNDELTLRIIDQAVFYQTGSGIVARIAASGETVYFNTQDTDLLARRLRIRSMIIEEEAEPRSGRGRAAADDLGGDLRTPFVDEAAYAAAGGVFTHIDESALHWKSVNSANKIVSTITHAGPWRKGVRDPGQAATMGGQNAKNYVVSHHPEWTVHHGEHTFDALRQRLGGRYEWLHLIGSSLGGPNSANNLVAGSYDANTKMIALEHRVALWGQLGYDGNFMPMPSAPLVIRSEAEVYPGTNIGKTIDMLVTRGGAAIVTGHYEVEDQRVLTKAAYDAEETRVDAATEANRPPMPNFSGGKG